MAHMGVCLNSCSKQLEQITVPETGGKSFFEPALESEQEYQDQYYSHLRRIPISLKGLKETRTSVFVIADPATKPTSLYFPAAPLCQVAAGRRMHPLCHRRLP